MNMWMLLARSFRLLACIGVVSLLCAPSTSVARAAVAEHSLLASADASRAAANSDTQPVEVGLRFTTAQAGTVNAVRFLKAPGDSSAHQVSLWSGDGIRLASATSVGERDSGWQQVALPTPVPVVAGGEYVVSYHTERYLATVEYFSTDMNAGPLTAYGSGNGVFRYGASAFPIETWRSTNYWVDVVFTAAGGSGGTPPPGFPNGSNTGVPQGVVLQPRTAADVTTPGTVIDGAAIHGGFVVSAPNVTIRRSRIECTEGYWLIRILPSATNFRLEDSTLVGDPGYCEAAIRPEAPGLVIARVDIGGFPNGVEGYNGFTVVDSYIHDLKEFPGQGNHVDGIQIGGGDEGPYLIRHNTILNPVRQTGCVSLFNDFGPIVNITVESNYLDGGGYTMYGGGPVATNVRVLDNTFGRTYWPNGGQYGPIAYWSTDPSNVWSGNVWTDGTPVLP